MKSLMKKCLLALLLALGSSYALADDWIQFPDPSGGTSWCQPSTGYCILLDSNGPIDP